MTSSLELVEGAYESFAEGDIDGFLAPFSADFTWIEAEGGPYGGTYHGTNELLEGVLMPIGTEWDEFRIEPERFVDGGETIVAIGTHSGTYSATGESFEADFTHVWVLEDGEITEFQQFTDTVLFVEPLEEGSQRGLFGDMLPGPP